MKDSGEAESTQLRGKTRDIDAYALYQIGFITSILLCMKRNKLNLNSKVLTSVHLFPFVS